MKCDHHDYIEIVCMYQYHIELVLISGKILQGQAINTQWNASQQECIQLKQNGVDGLVVLDTIAEMNVLTKNPHITHIKFTA